jgi:HNH endonuclease
MNPPGITKALRRRIRNDAERRCGYCLSRQGLVLGVLEIEHIVPLAKGGTDEETNLWLSCSLCNRHKATQVAASDPLTSATVPLFNPRNDKWHEHFGWSADGVLILGSTAKGRATVEALRLNNELAVEVRRNWVLAGWHPPTE